MNKTERRKFPLRSRDRLLILIALSGVVALAWAYLFKLSVDMGSMNVSAMDMNRIAGMNTWTSVEFLLMFVMWAVMMVGMMVPTAMRAVLIYAGIAQRADAQGTPVAPTYWFVSGYVLLWTVFSAGATVLQAGFTQGGLLSPMMVSSSATLGAGLLIAAGLYQLTPWKDACLKHCQSPAMYLASRFKSGTLNAIGLGIRHAGYCLGCCWLLMGLLFLGGVMNLLWIAAITIFVLVEKLLAGSFLSRAGGVVMIGAGLLYLQLASGM